MGLAKLGKSFPRPIPNIFAKLNDKRLRKFCNIIA